MVTEASNINHRNNKPTVKLNPLIIYIASIAKNIGKSWKESAQQWGTNLLYASNNSFLFFPQQKLEPILRNLRLMISNYSQKKKLECASAISNTQLTLRSKKIKWIITTIDFLVLSHSVNSMNNQFKNINLSI